MLQVINIKFGYKVEFEPLHGSPPLSEEAMVELVEGNDIDLNVPEGEVEYDGHPYRYRSSDDDYYELTGAAATS